MALTPRADMNWKALTAVLAAAATMGFASLPLSAPTWVRNALSLGRSDDLHNTPSVARFDVDSGGGFILDRSHRPALLKFDNSPEIWVLSASRGPRGDELYKNDIGETMLRATKLGGVTVFTARRPAGSAAALAGSASPLKMAQISSGALYQHMVSTSVRFSHMARHLVGFEAPAADAKSAPLIADAATLAVEGCARLSAQDDGRASLAKVGKVVVIKGSRVGAWMMKGALVIYINPGQGLAGHPSSARIVQAISYR